MAPTRQVQSARRQNLANLELNPPALPGRCLSIDLEVSPRDARIRKLAAVRGDDGRAFAYSGANIVGALVELDAFAAGLDFLLGHNIIAFDRPHLAAAMPALGLLKLPVIDTLLLNPLAFPRNPYHHLVKHYQDGQLRRGRLNDPELDARLALEVFADQRLALAGLADRDPDLAAAWHWLTTADGEGRGLDCFFAEARSTPRPREVEAKAAIARCLDDRSCSGRAREAIGDAARAPWPLAFALAWLSVAGGNSVMPPWVRHQMPESGVLVRRLRDTACSDADCAWCRARHDAVHELKLWFGFDDFRPTPVDAEGRPLQKVIVESAMRGDHVLGILPTGTGKSLCYQLPALSRYDKTGALTVVISPLVALMADQVAGLEARGISSCAALNGLLSMPERQDVLDRVRLGDVAILIVSPEQLRNRSFRRVVAQREIGAWVLDEAHCLSKWGHDFRPDYRYVARFIRERAGEGPVPPVLCLTATAKPDVVLDIVAHFRERVGVDLAVFDGGANRENLEFAVVPTTGAEKLGHLARVLEHHLPSDAAGGAIVYCATRANTEETAAFLREKGFAADHFHAGLKPETRSDVQRRFIRGDLKVIVATNAFGMGIDKPDVRLVVHADIPGSLENYLQEAGRAGRDRRQAHCVLLYCVDDVERQFGMSARSRLTRAEIQAILRALRRLDRKKDTNGEVVATAGEILGEEDEGAFERDSATDDTRVRTAVSWLEESALVSREENRVQVFPSSLRIASLDEARQRLERRGVRKDYRERLLRIVDALIQADRDDGVTTDELMGVAQLGAEDVRRALYDLEQAGIASNDTALTAYVHVAVPRSSQKRLEEETEIERALIAMMRESDPDLGRDGSGVLHLRVASQRLKDQGHETVLPEKLWRLLGSIAGDGRSEDGGRGSIGLRRLDPESVRVTLQREWAALERTADLRRQAAAVLLAHLLDSVPDGARGNDVLAETTLGRLAAALEGDLAIRAGARDLHKLLDRALLWLHEQEVIRLNRGLAVFRPAMTIRLARERRGFRKADFEPLHLHYHEQVLQIHVMSEYARRAVEAMAEAVRLAMDYFRLSRDAFLDEWLPRRDKELARQTTPASWQAIVEALNNPVQQHIVADDREQTNVLVLAGPGSGKTRVLVHRIAYLVRVRRENPTGIVALAYNRHAAADIRRRLADLIGKDARGVTVLTLHALAMRLTGASFQRRAAAGEESFREVIRQAVSLLRGEDIPPDEADARRDRLLGGFRWILVDEYQDIDADEYELIAALAGRTLGDEDRRLGLFAVGDDDQNIYAFRGASVGFIRRFETDYAAKPAYLVENYRSTGHIIAAANRVIEPARLRMKSDHPITIDRRRAGQPPGGAWQRRDPVTRGRVQVLDAGPDMHTQAMAVITEIERLASLDPAWRWDRVAVIAREWKYLEPVRSGCELRGLPVERADDAVPPFWRLRETQALVDHVRNRSERLIDGATVGSWLKQQPAGPWWDVLRHAVDEYSADTGGAELSADHLFEWLAEWGRGYVRRQHGLLLLTAHRAKGLEFDHVVILDGGWRQRGYDGEPDAVRRLYYVAMTRARFTLCLARLDGAHPVIDGIGDDPAIVARGVPAVPSPPELYQRYVALTLEDVDIGFAGRHRPGHPVHRAIGSVMPGDPLTLATYAHSWYLLDGAGTCVGRLAGAFEPPADMQCIGATAAAVVTRTRDNTPEPYLERLKCDRWEVVLAELVFAPETMTAASRCP